MPFHKCHVEDQRPIPELESGKPRPNLRQDAANSFTLLESFCYHVPVSDPDHGTIYIVPAADVPSTTGTERYKVGAHDVVVPPNDDGRTDLASVPWFFWWLIASYGNHTRAALLHDALIMPSGTTPPVPRTTADRLLLRALREADGKAGVFRHWLMWAAASVFGTMGERSKWQPFIFSFHVILLWITLDLAVAISRGPDLWHSPWSAKEIVGATLVTLLAVFGFAALMGLFWRAGIDKPGGWLTTIVPLLALSLSGIYATWDDRWSVSFSLFVASAALVILGLPWGNAVDATLKHWLWPTAIIGLPIAILPLALIFAAVALVWVIDLGAAISAGLTTTESGKRRGFDLPSIRPMFQPPV